MRNTRLFKRGRDRPHFARGASQIGCNIVQNLQARRVDAVIIGDQNAHDTARVIVKCCLNRPAALGRQAMTL